MTMASHLGRSLALLFLLVPVLQGQNPSEEKPKDAGEKPRLLSAEPLKIDPRDDELQKLLKARYNEAVAEVRSQIIKFEFGGPFEMQAGAFQRLTTAGIELSATPEERVEFLTRILEVAKWAEAVTEAGIEVGRRRTSDLHQPRYLRLDVEIQLLRARQEARKPKP